jgi:serine/threonine-protein kinase
LIIGNSRSKVAPSVDFTDRLADNERRMNAVVDPLIGASIGSYKVTAKIGSGGMGAVYMGVHPAIGKKVAIKILHPEYNDKTDVLERFVREGKAASLLRHQHIVEVFDLGRQPSAHGDIHYCVMELLEGEALRDRMKNGPIPENVANQWTIQIASPRRTTRRSSTATSSRRTSTWWARAATR